MIVEATCATVSDVLVASLLGAAFVAATVCAITYFSDRQFFLVIPDDLDDDEPWIEYGGCDGQNEGGGCDGQNGGCDDPGDVAEGAPVPANDCCGCDCCSPVPNCFDKED